jgi:hypothetical protein
VLNSLRPSAFPVHQSGDVRYFCCMIMAWSNYNSIELLWVMWACPSETPGCDYATYGSGILSWNSGIIIEMQRCSLNHPFITILRHILDFGIVLRDFIDSCLGSSILYIIFQDIMRNKVRSASGKLVQCCFE